MVSGAAIATLVVFILSIFFVIYPLSFPIFLPYSGRRRFHINLTTAPIVAILILWAAQCLGPQEIRDGIVGTDGIKPYNIVILFFSLAYMAITFDITGILKSAAFWVRNKGGSNGWKLFLYLYLLSTVISVFLGNNPVILTVFLVYYTKVNQLNPIAWLMSEFAAANTASMVLFFGNPTNVVICQGFQVNTTAFTAYTILPFLACSLTCFFALAIQFRHVKYIPKKLNVSGNLDVRSVLLDPVGACVGSAMLGICLVLIIVVGFLKAEVWTISLPFAFGKFLWDLGWDTYRYDYMTKHPILEGKKENPNMDREGNDAMLRQLRQWGTQATINMDELGLETEPENAVSNVATISTVPSTAPFNKPNQGVTTVTIDERTNSVEPIDISHRGIPTITFDETHPSSPALSIQAHADLRSDPLSTPTSHQNSGEDRLLSSISDLQRRFSRYLSIHVRTIHTAFPRLPFALVPFAFSQFILIEGLSRQGWIDIFANWLVIMTKREIFKTVWVVGFFGVLLCNVSGTDIGATILLTKIVTAAASSYVPPSSGPKVNIEAFLRSAAIALAVASNTGAVSFTFSASLAGLLWRDILVQNGIHIRQKTFAWWNLLPVTVMTVVGLAVVSAQMAVLY